MGYYGFLALESIHTVFTQINKLKLKVNQNVNI